MKLSEGQIRDEVMEDYEQAEVDGIGNLPATLARFLAERMEMPGFTYEVIHDENRGWIIPVEGIHAIRLGSWLRPVLRAPLRLDRRVDV